MCGTWLPRICAGGMTAARGPSGKEEVTLCRTPVQSATVFPAVARNVLSPRHRAAGAWLGLFPCGETGLLP